MSNRKTILLLRPLAGVLDSMNRVIPIPLLAICRKLDPSVFRIEIVDQRMPRWRERLDRALDERPIVVGITCLTGYQIYFGERLARYVRRRVPEAPIVWGGVHPSAAPEQTLNEDFVDFVVVGEGEDVFPAFVEKILRGENPGTLPGVGYKTDRGKTQVNPRPPLQEIADLEDLPYHLLNMADYVERLENTPFYGVEGARGCVHNCTFCYNPGYNHKQWRPRKAARVVTNMVRLHRTYGIRNFFISDDSFFASMDRALELASSLVSENLSIKWGCEANLSDLCKLDESALRLLEKSGLDMLSMGVESGSKRVIRFVRKPVNLDDLIAFNKRIRRFNIHPKYTFLTGTPVEDKRELLESVALVRQILQDNDSALVQAFYLATPYPGTIYLEQCRRYGFIPPERLEQWADFDPFAVAKHLPWVRGRRKRMFEFMMYNTLFIDRKIDYHLSESSLSAFTSRIGRIYRPVARFRFNHFLHSPYPEGAVIKLINAAQKALVTDLLRRT